MSMSRRQLLKAMAAACCTAPWIAGCTRRTGADDDADPALLDIATAGEAIRDGRLSPVELVQAYLDRIVRFDGELRCFITVLADAALAEARTAEAEIRGGRWRGPLHGIPIGIKDNIDVAGVPTTAASAALAGYLAATDAPAVQRLREAGAIVLGKLNMHELALGTTSTASHFGAVRNPWSLDHVAGGSSSGSAAAVAAALCAGAVGTDTGGSVRVPAACCGVVGLKPTHDAIDPGGLRLISRSFDHVGPLARTVTDVGLLFAAMARSPWPAPDAPAAATLRVGVPDDAGHAFCYGGVDREVQAVFETALDDLRALVLEIQPVRLPLAEHDRVLRLEGLLTYQELIGDETALLQPLTVATMAAEPADLDPELAVRELPGLRESLARYRAGTAAWFAEVDLVVSPTLPTAAILLSEAGEAFAQRDCTFPFNAAGLPALSLPCGFTAAGLPIGLQVIGPAGAESRVLALANAYERATPWHRMRPPRYFDAA